METRAPFVIVGAFVCVWFVTGCRPARHIAWIEARSGLLVRGLFNGSRGASDRSFPRGALADHLGRSTTPVRGPKVGLEFQGLTGH